MHIYVYFFQVIQIWNLSNPTGWTPVFSAGGSVGALSGAGSAVLEGPISCVCGMNRAMSFCPIITEVLE